MARAGAKGAIFIRKKDWERLLTTIKTLVDVHTQLLKRSKELRDELKYPAPKIKRERKEKRPLFSGVCLNCGRDILKNDRYCDRCGFEVVRRVQ